MDREILQADLAIAEHLSFLAEKGSERAAAVKGAHGAAERTLDGQDRSEIIGVEGMAGCL